MIAPLCAIFRAVFPHEVLPIFAASVFGACLSVFA